MVESRFEMAQDICTAMPPLSSDDEVESLRSSLIDLMETTTHSNVQAEASRLIACIVEQDPRTHPDDLVLIESALAALKAKSVNIQVAKFIRNKLEIDRRNRKSGFVPWLSRKLGDSPVYAMLIGAATSAVVWVIAFVAVYGLSKIWIVVGNTDFIMPPDEVLPLAFASFVGGLASLLSRIDDFSGVYIFDPFLVFLNSFLKPLIATVFAITIYALLKSGVVQIPNLQLNVQSDGYRYVFWAFGFVAGFSERLAGDFITRAGSAIGLKQTD